jgi:hypothetical protein
MAEGHDLLNSLPESFAFHACVLSGFRYTQSMTPTIIGIASQKVGVGKSTLARLIAREYAAADWNVKIADLDIGQEPASTGSRGIYSNRSSPALLWRGSAPSSIAEPLGSAAILSIHSAHPGQQDLP